MSVLGLSREEAKALLIHSSTSWEKQKFDIFKIGHGIVPQRIEDVVNTIVSASVEASFFLKAKAIVAATVTGFTAHTASYYRPSVPIIASCTDEKATRQLKLDYGVYPFYAELTNDLDVMKTQALKIAEKSKIVEKDDLVILVCGSLTGGNMSADTMIITKA